MTRNDWKTKIFDQFEVSTVKLDEASVFLQYLETIF